MTDHGDRLPKAQRQLERRVQRAGGERLHGGLAVLLVVDKIGISGTVGNDSTPMMSMKTCVATPGIIGRVQPLPSRPWKAPRRKFRGKKRYFRRVLRRAEAFRLDTPPDAWWDYWHYHADWPGWGNLAWKYRFEHLRALAVVFRKVLETSALIPVPFQTWICLDVDDAAQDGVFVHSPNPNHSDFPFKPDATWGDGALDETMTALLPGLSLRVGQCSWLGEDDDGAPCVRSTHLVYSLGAGMPLE